MILSHREKILESSLLALTRPSTQLPVRDKAIGSIRIGAGLFSYIFNGIVD